MKIRPVDPEIIVLRAITKNRNNASKIFIPVGKLVVQSNKLHRYIYSKIQTVLVIHNISLMIITRLNSSHSK